MTMSREEAVALIGALVVAFTLPALPPSFAAPKSPTPRRKS